MRLVLASASPARRATLTAAGVACDVIVSGVDERAALSGFLDIEPVDVALVLARAKAEEVAGRAGTPSGLVLGCDSVFEIDGQAYGRPADAAAARAHWRTIRGRTGALHTGHWVVDTRSRTKGGTGGTLGAVASTAVHFADVTDAEIDAYVATGEPLAVAGGFAVDGLGGAFVAGIEGDHHNVIGVSLPLLRRLLADLGVAWPSLWT